MDMKKKTNKRALAFFLSFMMLFSLVQGISAFASEDEGEIQEILEVQEEQTSVESLEEVPEESVVEDEVQILETAAVEEESEPLDEEDDSVIMMAGLPNRSPQKLENVIDSIKIVNHAGNEHTPDEGGVINLNRNIRYRYLVSFDLSAYNDNLVNGDYFTFTIPAPIPVEAGTIAFTDPTTGVQIATGNVISNGGTNGGSATVTLQNLGEYLASTGGETIQDVKGTFYVSFQITEEMTETTVTFETEETINQISHTFRVTIINSGDQSGRVGETNFEKRLNTTTDSPFTSEALGKTIPYSASWYGRINVRQASYDKIVITDTIDIEEHAPMQFIPELLYLRTGYFGSNYEFVYDDFDSPLIQGQHYEVTYNESYTEFVLTIENPTQFTAANRQPAAFWLSYSTTITNDGTEVYNAMKMTADDQVLTQKTTDSKNESVQETSVQTTNGGTISIDTSYSITLYKVDKTSLKALPGAVFKITTPTGETIEMEPTDENGRTHSRQFTSAEAAAGSFTVVEVTPPNGYKLDTTPFTVTLGQEGVVKTITNELLDASGSIALEGMKELTGRNLKAGEFHFVVKEDGKIVSTGTNDAEGNITFDGIEFKRNAERNDIGVHTYVISEVKENLGGVEYDESEFTVTVTVADNGNGTLSANPVYPDGGVVFKNTYSAKKTQITLEGTKELTGRDLNAGEFSFTVSDDGEEVATGTNDADGNIEFSTIEYTADDIGTHTLIITEETGEIGGVDYSNESYTVTVTVSDNGQGKIEAAAVIPDSGIVFHNEYNAAEAIVTLEAKKNLSGADLKADQFSFLLKDEDGEVVEEVKNDAEGTVRFSSLSFTEAGEYRYTISEVKGDENGITYDETVYTVTISVTDDLNGNLAAVVDTEDKDLVFNNEYIPEDPKQPTTPKSTTPKSSTSKTSTSKSSTPRTGDGSDMIKWMIVLLFAVSACSILTYRKRQYK